MRPGRLAPIACLALLAAAPALAQTKPPAEHLIPGWSEGLTQQGIDLTLEYKGEVVGNVSGPFRSARPAALA